MKNKIKTWLFGFIIGVLICGTTVYASTVLASDIAFVSNNKTFNVNNVNDAINTLYDEAQQKKDYYSEDETIIGRWIDGKPIYRKIYKQDITYTTGWLDTGIDVSDLNIETLVDGRTIEASGKATTDNTILIDNNKITRYSGHGFRASIFIIEYTKTTDNPING